MTKVYLNYPNPHMTIHGDSACLQIGKMDKLDQRTVTITPDSFADAICQLDNKTFQFGSSAPVNDAWLSVDFDDQLFEAAVADYVLRLLGKRYVPLQGVRIRKHC